VDVIWGAPPAQVTQTEPIIWRGSVLAPSQPERGGEEGHPWLTVPWLASGDTRPLQQEVYVHQTLVGGVEGRASDGAQAWRCSGYCLFT
jgi:hypothetical protein